MPHVTILGAGVIGLSTALYACQRGWQVTVVEPRSAVRDGCSFGNAGMVVPSHFIPLAAPGMVALGLKWMLNPESPFYIQPRLDSRLLAWGWSFWKASTRRHVQAAAPLLRDFGLLSRQCFDTLSPTLDLGLVKRGLLMLCKTAHALDDEARAAALAQDLGLPAHVLDARQTAQLDPAVTLDILGSVHYPQDCHLSPARYMDALETTLRQRGVRFCFGATLTRVESRPASSSRRHIQRLHAGDDSWETDALVLAAGVWSDELARQFDLHLPLQPGKGYSLTLDTPRQLPTLCSICTEARLAVTPMGSQLRVGGTMEIAGLDESINTRRVRGITRAFPQYFPAFQESDFAAATPWSGLRPVSPDGLPYLGRPRHWENLIVATGHAMMGLSLAPATGSIVASLLQHEPPPLDLTLLSPDRFSRA